MSENTHHRWRNQYGGLKDDVAKRLKELERQNQRLVVNRVRVQRLWREEGPKGA